MKVKKRIRRLEKRLRELEARADKGAAEAHIRAHEKLSGVVISPAVKATAGRPGRKARVLR